MAKRWVETNIPAGAKILIENGDLKLSPGKKYYEEMLERAKKSEKSQFTIHAEWFYKLSLEALPEITYDVGYIRFPWWQRMEENPDVYFATTDYDIDMGNPLKPVGVRPYEFYRRNGYQYVLTSSEKHLDFQEDSQKSKNFPAFYKFYKELFEQGVLIK